MIACTSIAPGHKNFESQFKAVESWKKAGYKVVSLNSPEEIKELKDFEGVKFVPTHRHNKILFGKPHVVASALIDYLKDEKDEHNLLINSDIIIQENGNTDKIKALSKTGIVIMNRRDFDISPEEKGLKLYEPGFDGFFINYKYLDLFPQTLLCLGQCFWDYWVPYSAIVAGTKVYKFDEPYLFHQKHGFQYSHEHWRKAGQLFRAETGLMNYTVIEKFSDYMFKKIKMSIQ